MELVFIGTGSGRTSLKRHHSSFCFVDQRKVVLIDVGDGICKALLSQSIDFNSITDIIISHYHSDHLAGLPSLLTQMIIQKRTAKLNIFTHSNLVNSLKIFLNISSIFLEKLNFDVEIVPFEFDKPITLSNNITVSAKQNSHVSNKHNLSIDNINFISSSFLFEYGKKKIVYTSDIGNYEDLFLFQDYNADFFITESTHVPLEKMDDAITILNPDQVYLTHIDNE
ncbi:MAG: MBL fold metallo-hydrolase, partial [Melioribacteraceae bacterium]|nr:MBL fold metallo-hydrolase [Melioribacteraceae bacterium]